MVQNSNNKLFIFVLQVSTNDWKPKHLIAIINSQSFLCISSSKPITNFALNLQLFQGTKEATKVVLLVWLKLGPFARTCNPSKWEADIWGWLEVRRSAMLHFNERQRPHWACRQYGHTGGTRGWLGVERWQLCLRDTSRSANCHRRAAVGHWISLYVKCCRMVDSVPIWHTISIL